MNAKYDKTINTLHINEPLLVNSPCKITVFFLH